MNPDPLMMPVGALARPLEPLHAEDSLQRALQLRRAVGHALPVVVGTQLIGVIDDATLARIRAEAVPMESAVEGFVSPASSLSAAASGADALRRFAEGPSLLVIVDPQGFPVGVLTPADLFERPISMPVPSPVGGMATPFGVYLTNGVISGGVPHWALVLTGAFLFSVFLVGDALSVGLFYWLPDAAWKETLVTAVPILFFVAALRLLPISGTHAAEHQVVHAMERGEPLTVEVVRRMPRVHPRCGTNLAVALTLFMTVFLTEWGPPEDVRILAAVLLTLFFARPLGSFAQWAITTAPPSDRQVQSGIRAAEDLIQKYARSRKTHAHPLTRMVASGILHVIAGASLAGTLAHFLNKWFNGPFGW